MAFGRDFRDLCLVLGVLSDPFPPTPIFAARTIPGAQDAGLWSGLCHGDGDAINMEHQDTWNPIMVISI